jgi:hypothetical protein
MARPKAKDGIRVTTRARNGIQLVHFEEHPGHWIISPEYDRDKAIAWAKRNREKLVRQKNQPIAEYCMNFYALDGQWVNRRKQKGHHYTDRHLKNRQGYLNHFSRVFGKRKPQDIDHAEFRREFDNWLLTLNSYLDDKKKFIQGNQK